MNESKINVAEIFPRLPLFSELSESQRAVLLESTRVKTVSKGELLFQRGDAPQGFFYVISGQIKLAFRRRRATRRWWRSSGRARVLARR